MRSTKPNWYYNTTRHAFLRFLGVNFVNFDFSRELESPPSKAAGCAFAACNLAAGLTSGSDMFSPCYEQAGTDDDRCAEQDGEARPLTKDQDAHDRRPYQRAVIHRHHGGYGGESQGVGDGKLGHRAEYADAQQVSPGPGIMAAAVNIDAHRKGWQSIDREPEDSDQAALCPAQHTDDKRDRCGDQRPDQCHARAESGDHVAAGLNHYQHADKADQYGYPAPDADLLPQDQRREQGCENRHGKADRRRIGQRQQGHRPEIEPHRRNTQYGAQDMQRMTIGFYRWPLGWTAPDQEAYQRHRDQLPVKQALGHMHPALPRQFHKDEHAGERNHPGKPRQDAGYRMVRP